ncbi:hypothetical protein Tco_0012313 [Tanacetum coccineum]
MFILYCCRAIVEDSNLAREIDGLCAGLTARIEEREYFIDELDVLADRFVPEKMAEFMKETQEKDRNRLMRLQILGREFELRADEKKHFIEKLNGNVFALIRIRLSENSQLSHPIGHTREMRNPVCCPSLKEGVKICDVSRGHACLDSVSLYVGYAVLCHDSW